MNEIDRVIHEPIRLRIMSILSGVDKADFKFVLSTLGLSKGNLSSHIDKLEQAGYVAVEKGFRGKVTYTEYSLTKSGKKALAAYWSILEEIRAESVSLRQTAPLSPSG
jgi:DNA-binding transcriptional ArsR family regulator